MLRPGDIVVAASSGSLSVVGKAAQLTTPFDGTFGAFCKVVRPSARVHARYLGHFFRTKDYRTTISALAAGANINNLKNEHINDLMIRLPSLDQQRRISAILDHADAIRTNHKRSVALLRQLRRAFFRTTFADLAKYPEYSFSDLVASQRIGLVRAAGEFGDGLPFPYVRMDAISRDGEILFDLIKTTDASGKEAVTYSLQAGDFLFNTRNSRELVGKAAVWNGPDGCLFNNNIMRVRFGALVLPDYVQQVLLTPGLRHELETRKTGTTSVFAVYWRDLQTLPVPVPPISLQASFSTKLHEVERLRAAYEDQLTVAEALFASLQHRAFNGEL